MANLFFPQLMSGALAQYPIRKSRIVRTVKNILPDGNLLLYSDPAAGHLIWQLEYTELTKAEMAALQGHFDACAGPLRAFTFIDPTDNMLAWSRDITQSCWKPDPSIQVSQGTSDPTGNSGAFTILNSSQVSAGIRQTLAVPANYQYCLSVYIRSAEATTISLNRSSSSASVTDCYVAGATWTRVISSGRLADIGATFSVGVALGAGQQAQIYGLQLEAQLAPSRYRATDARGGVYASAYWGVDELPIIATAPGQFSTAFNIEAGL